MEKVIVEVKRKIWKPNKVSSTLVVSLPPNTVFKLGDKVKVGFTNLDRIIVEKEVA